MTNPTTDPATAPEMDDQTTPLLRIVNTDATPDEIAALVGVLSSLGSAAPTPRRPAPAWQARHRAVRRTLPHGPGGWRASGLPG
jgi:Acyl-CoA carboxylase epsilon subunit